MCFFLWFYSCCLFGWFFQSWALNLGPPEFSAWFSWVRTTVEPNLEPCLLKCDTLCQRGGSEVGSIGSSYRGPGLNSQLSSQLSTLQSQEIWHSFLAFSTHCIQVVHRCTSKLNIHTHETNLKRKERICHIGTWGSGCYSGSPWTFDTLSKEDPSPSLICTPSHAHQNRRLAAACRSAT